MPPLDYLLLRVARRFLPASVTRFLLRRRWIIRPGLETRAPVQAVDRYQAELHRLGRDWSGQRVLVFGYGGFFGVAVELLRRGAAHVVLCDRYARPDAARNAALARNPAYAAFFAATGPAPRPRPEAVTLVHDDIRAAAHRLPPVDIVLSSSVYEHLDDVDGITAALARLTRPTGVHIHFVDLRDHFFKYPFEMLTYSERVWRAWLNPGSNLNRWRVPQYETAFRRHFAQVQVRILARDPDAFRRARPRIRTEFLTGDEHLDAATEIVIVAQQPRPRPAVQGASSPGTHR